MIDLKIPARVPHAMNVSNVTNANVYCKYDESHSDVERAVQMATLSIIGGFGVFGNVFTIVLVAKYTIRRTLHFLIINMAVSDIAVIIMTIIASTSTLDYRLWDDVFVVAIGCKTMFLVYGTLHVISLVTLLIISIERYRITKRQAVQISTRRYSIKQRVFLIGLSWLISIAMNLHLPILISYNPYDGFCKAQPWVYFIVFSCINALTKVSLFSILLLLSILTLRMISFSQANENNLPEVIREKRKKRIRNAVGLVLYSLFLYAFCYLPLIIFRFYYSLTHLLAPSIDLCIDWKLLDFIIAYLLPLFNSSFSPCVYFICLSDFRRAAKGVFR